VEVLIRIGIDTLIMIIGGAVFAVFWVKTAGWTQRLLAARFIYQACLSRISRKSAVLRGFDRYTSCHGDRWCVLGIMSVVANLFGVIGSVSGTGFCLPSRLHIVSKNRSQVNDHGNVSVHANILW
jgi:preprotein translocase subunit SecY